MFTTAKAAKRLNISVETLYRWLRKGLISEPNISFATGSKGYRARYWTEEEVAAADTVIRLHKNRGGHAFLRAVTRAKLEPNDRIIGPSDLARIFKIRKEQIYEWTRKRFTNRYSVPPMPRVRVATGRYLFFNQRDIYEWIERIKK